MEFEFVAPSFSRTEQTDAVFGHHEYLPAGAVAGGLSSRCTSVFDQHRAFATLPDCRRSQGGGVADYPLTLPQALDTARRFARACLSSRCVTDLRDS